ncbi:MAG: hypothetical protein ABEJ72_09275 [Candidatus Aenigmatarchaeota archaeon]
MPRWSSSRTLGKKAQFFIISTVILAVFLSVISNNLGGYASIDTSSVSQKDEGLIFNNLKNQAKSIIDSNSCPDTITKLKDFKHYVRSDLRSRGMKFEMNVTDPCPTPITISMNITSPDMEIRDRFTYP